MDERSRAAIESFRQATEHDITSFLIFIFIILALLFLILLGFHFRKTIKNKVMKKLFLKNLKEKNIPEKGGEIIWKYSKKLGRDPFLALEFKAPFEKVISMYVEENPNYDEDLLKELRKKLGFDICPPFVPLSSTKDIDVFQSGRISTETKEVYNAALYDKDEKFMFWYLIDAKTNLPHLKGKTVKVTMLRRGDAIYKVSGTVEDVFVELDKTIIKLPHSFDMERIQRREHARVDVEIPAVVEKVETLPSGVEKVNKTEGIIADISVGGVRFCISADKRNEANLNIGNEVTINFTLENRKLSINCSIVNTYERKTTVCYGLKFKKLEKYEENLISDFVKKEQKRMMKILQMQRG
ncbi:flagellar brake protein [Persephonella sp.]